jgi:hypothetical protein
MIHSYATQPVIDGMLAGRSFGRGQRATGQLSQLGLDPHRQLASVV